MDSSIDITVPEETILEACGKLELPDFGIIEQLWDTNPIPIDEISEQTTVAVEALSLKNVPDDGEIAVGVGSRGITNLPLIVYNVIETLENMGYNPFIFPAMGSHGGATTEGQRKMLRSLGVTEKQVNCEIRSSMDVVQVGETPKRNVPVVIDSNAASADAILPINRIKPHTDYDGPVESGLSKMLVIGMGKQRGAKTAHEWAVDWSFRTMIPEITEQLLEVLPVIGGIAIVEDQFDETTHIEGIQPEGFLNREVELLEKAYGLLPSLPFGEIDVLILDQQGKEISGQGIDTNVIGRRPFAINEPEPEFPNIKRIFVRALTEKTHGNAMGVGSADFVHQRVATALESSTTLINAITASTIRGVRLPPVVETDRSGLVGCLSTIGVVDSSVRVLRASDTMHLHRIYASQALVEEARNRDDLLVVEEPRPIEFSSGDFVAPSPDQD